MQNLSTFALGKYFWVIRPTILLANLSSDYCFHQSSNHLSIDESIVNIRKRTIFVFLNKNKISKTLNKLFCALVTKDLK